MFRGLTRGVNFEDTKPLTPAQRERFDRARTIPPLAEEREQSWVVVSIDSKLLAKAQARARREGKTSSILVNELLRAAEQQISQLTASTYVCPCPTVSGSLLLLEPGMPARPNVDGCIVLAARHSACPSTNARFPPRRWR
jgi:hypothetical protein